MTVEELKKLNILNTNEQLPTLEETLKLINKKVIRVGILENENDDLSKLIIKTINLLEYSVKNIEIE